MIDLTQFKQSFIHRFGREPRIFRAPARVNLIGEHTDYNEGFVMPFAIEPAVYVAASPRDDRRITVRSEGFPEALDIGVEELETIEIPEDWRQYPLGVLSLIVRAGYEVQGADFLATSDVPTGAGLSSSAALEVGMATAIKHVFGLGIDKVGIAKIGQATENEFVGVRSGIMDQMASVLSNDGQALFLDCRSLEWSHIPLGNSVFIVCDTRTKHSLAESEYNKRRQECDDAASVLGLKALRDAGLRNIAGLPTTLQKRARHVITENARVLSTVEALRKGDVHRVGELMNASHQSLRNDFEVSCNELDVMSEICRSQPGILGSRMTGGGFGGCTVSVCAEDVDLKSTFDSISEKYMAATAIEPVIFACRPLQGAGEMTNLLD